MNIRPCCLLAALLPGLASGTALAENCTSAAQLSGGARIQAGDHEGRIIEELGPPDRVVSTGAERLGDVQERLIYYIPDRGRMETIIFEVANGRMLRICELRHRRR